MMHYKTEYWRVHKMLNQSILTEQTQGLSPNISGMPAIPVMPAASGYNKSASQSVYKQTAVETASPEKLLIMLYKGAVRFLHMGEKALTDQDYETANESLTRALDIVAELNATLNLEAGEVAVNLRDLYFFYAREITSANVKRDPAYLKPVIEFFVEFSDVWTEAASSLQA
jgi:flagellar protein FliS